MGVAYKHTICVANMKHGCISTKALFQNVCVCLCVCLFMCGRFACLQPISSIVEYCTKAREMFQLLLMALIVLAFLEKGMLLGGTSWTFVVHLYREKGVHFLYNFHAIISNGSDLLPLWNYKQNIICYDSLYIMCCKALTPLFMVKNWNKRFGFLCFYKKREWI